MYSNLNALNEIYSDIDALQEVHWIDSMDVSSCVDDDLEFELNEALLDADALMFEVRNKYGGFKTILEYAKEHPEAKDECRDFYFLDGDFTV